MNKKITINFILNISYQILIILLPLVTTPYVSRILGPNGIGIYSYTNSIITYFILFGCIGLNLYGQREIAYYQDDIYKRSIVFFEILFLRILTMMISISIFFITIHFIDQYKFIFYIQLLDLFSNMIDISFFYQGIEDFKKIVFRNILIKALSILSIFLFVKKATDLPVYVFIFSLSTFLGNLSFYISIKNFICKVPFKTLRLSKHIQPTLILFFPQIAISLYTVLDRFMIGIITNNTTQIGYYEQAQKIVKLALTLVTSLSTVMLPRVAHLYMKDDKEAIRYYTEQSLIYTLMLSFPIMFGIIGVANNLIPWFLGQKFLPSIMILKVTAPLILFIGLSNIVGLQYLIPTQKQKIYTLSTILGSVINLMLNIILIPKFNSIGAAFASVIAEAGVIMFQAYFTRKQIYYHRVFYEGRKFFIAALIMLLEAYILALYLNSSMLNTCIIIVISIFTYAIMLILLKDKYFNRILCQIKRKREI